MRKILTAAIAVSFLTAAVMSPAEAQHRRHGDVIIQQNATVPNVLAALLIAKAIADSQRQREQLDSFSNPAPQRRAPLK